jgi:peptidoglycan/LPS O-acetylase OafA/YrhL
MSHAIVWKLLKIALPSERYMASPLLLRLFVLFANATLIFLFAAGLYHAIEIPARNYMRRMARWWSDRAVEPKVGTQ